MKRRAQPETAIARALEQHYRVRGAPGVFMFSVPNGGWRRPIEAAIMKATGTRPGVPDTIWIKGGQAFGLELKSGDGRLTPTQLDCHERMRAAGAVIGVAYGIDQALEFLERHELLRGRTNRG